MKEDRVGNKILIITARFKPLNTTGSDRPYYWYKHLPSYGKSPIVICQDWGKIDEDVQNVIQVKLRRKAWRSFVSNKFIHKIYKQFAPFLDPWLLSDGEDELINTARNLLKEEKGISTIITTAGPFSLLHVGYRVKQEFPHLKWISDFRDDWSSNDLMYVPIPGVTQINRSFKRYLERKWVGKADAFTTVSELYKKKISFVLKQKVPGFALPNGYDFIKPDSFERGHDAVHFSYTGNIYENQAFEETIQAISETAAQFPDIKTRLYFVGSLRKISPKRVSSLQSISDYIEVVFKDRMKREELDAFNQKMDVFALTAYGDLKGIPSSKLYYFLSFMKPIFLFPSDHDVIEKTTEYCGVRIKDLTPLYESKRDKNPFKLKSIDPIKVAEFSREVTVKSLNSIIDQLCAS